MQNVKAIKVSQKTKQDNLITVKETKDQARSKETIVSKNLDLSEAENTLPPVVCLNLRQLILPEKVNIRFSDKTLNKKSVSTTQSARALDIVPQHALHITWTPNNLCFSINQDVIISRLWIWNLCPRTIYLRVCGFWNDAAKLGASWLCLPKTRFRLASGLKAEVFIKATPRAESPIPLAYMALQLAVAHVRDNVVGYFVVPVKVTFGNCTRLALAGEG